MLDHADIRLFFGASGSGKSYQLRRAIKGKPRVMVWDTMEDYNLTIIKDRAEMIEIAKRKNFRVSYRPVFARGIKEEFDFFCRLVYARGDMFVAVEELNQVTAPNYSPPAWRNLTCRGRHRDLHILSASQRPGGVDKDAIGNATEIMAGRLLHKADRDALLAQFGTEIKGLATFPDRKMIKWDAHA